MTDKGTRLDRLNESLARCIEAYERNRDNPTGADWLIAADRYRERIAAEPVERPSWSEVARKYNATRKGR